MTTRKPPRELSAVDAARAIEAGTLTIEALVRSCLERIEERNEQVQAFTVYDGPAVLAAARAADIRRDGILAGIPFATKDVIDTASLATEYGSPIYRGYRPRIDAACVVMARERGAVLLGKVSTSEFATQTPGPARNPLDLERTPGGSSSGSAAAVADFMAPVAFGTQTTGSIVRPAAYCGIVGYKPTYGFISVAGMKPLSPTQDTIGLLTRTVADAAFFAFGLHGVASVLSTPSRLRIGICESSQWQHASPDMVTAIHRAAAALERSGAAVSRLQLPAALERLAQEQPRVVAFEARQALAHERIQCRAQLSERLQARLDFGAQVSLDDYLSIRHGVDSARNDAAALLHDYDAILYPAADGEAESGHANSGSPRFGAVWTLLGLPCVSFPIGRAPSGMPLGAQLIGMCGGDLKLLAAANAVSRIGGCPSQ
jgi:Asp-tRNA(Asn)/Glu-tRNA(Gln) amidotransferase A subunit family amidase